MNKLCLPVTELSVLDDFQASDEEINAGLTDRPTLYARGCGESGSKGGTGAVGTRQFEAAMVGFRDPTSNGKAEASTTGIAFGTRARYVSAEEALEDPLLQFRGDAGTIVRNTDKIINPLTAAGESNGAARRGIFDGVIEEIEQHAAEQGLVAMDGQIRLDCRSQRNVFRESQGARADQGFRGKLVEVGVAQS